MSTFFSFDCYLIKKSIDLNFKVIFFSTEYNPNKSRLRKQYNDPAQAEDRARNNLASRRSRYKKKIAAQVLSLNLDFEKEENRKLFKQETWMATIISELEEKLLQSGFEPIVIKNLRFECGFK